MGRFYKDLLGSLFSYEGDKTTLQRMLSSSMSPCPNAQCSLLSFLKSGDYTQCLMPTQVYICIVFGVERRRLQRWLSHWGCPASCGHQKELPQNQCFTPTVFYALLICLSVVEPRSTKSKSPGPHALWTFSRSGLFPLIAAGGRWHSISCCVSPF